MKPHHPTGRGSSDRRESHFSAMTKESAIDPLWDFDPPPNKVPTRLLPENAKTILIQSRSPDLPFTQSINPYQGCEHGCSYCYARPTHGRFGHSPALDFETILYAKHNAAELLRVALSKPGYTPSPIALGTNTDPYQPIESGLAITRGLLQVAVDTHHPFTIVTKSARIRRDIDLLSTLAREELICVAISITTLDNRLSQTMEPRAASPLARLKAIEALASAGIPVGVFVAPLIPALNDHEMEAVLKNAQEAGASFANYTLVRLPDEVEGIFIDWLKTHYPLRAEHILSALSAMRDGNLQEGRFFHRMEGKGAFAAMLSARFHLRTKKLGLATHLPTLNVRAFIPPSPITPQGVLF